MNNELMIRKANKDNINNFSKFTKDYFGYTCEIDYNDHLLFVAAFNDYVVGAVGLKKIDELTYQIHDVCILDSFKGFNLEEMLLEEAIFYLNDSSIEIDNELFPELKY